jgi:hypothetical protein
MGVHVDEPGAEHQPGGIENFSRTLCGKVRFDRRDSAACEAHVGLKRRTVAGVDLGSSDQKVKRHCLTS